MCPKQRLDLSYDRTSVLLGDFGGHQGIIPADKKELFAIAPPMRVVTSICRNLPLAVAARK